MRAWLREPLLHFLAIGAAIFLLYRLVGGEQQGPREIVVSEARIEALAESFSRVWMRPPSADEIRGLVEDYIREEVYYREALALGLDRDDTVIRRRMRQKMEFVSGDIAATSEPADAELQIFLDSHAGAFQLPASFDFQQVFFSSDRRGEQALAEARRVAQELAGAGNGVAAPEGDPSLLPAQMSGVTPREVANVFGEAFSAEIENAPVGSWIGPVESPFGAHVVLVSAREEGRLPPLAEIRPAVLREWQAVRQKEVDEAFYRGLLDKYDVHVEGELGELLRRQADRGTSPSASDGRS